MIVQRARQIVLAGIVILVAAASLVASRFSDLRATGEQFLASIEANPTQNAVLFFGVQILVAACGIFPAAGMALAAGLIYGFSVGFVISVLATMLGGLAAFALARSALRPYTSILFRRYDKIERLDAAVTKEGWRFVCLLRMSPIMPFAATSYGLGLTEISYRHFLIGTLASIPSMAGYVAIGALGKEGYLLGREGAGPLQWALLAFGVIAVLLAVARVRKVMERRIEA